VRPSDAAAVFALRSDSLVMQHVNRPLAEGVEDAIALIDRITTSMAANEALQGAVTE